MFSFPIIRDENLPCGPRRTPRLPAADRAGSERRGASRGGAGLGLSIVRSFVELHGGEVSLDSQEDVGTTATIVLPMRPRIAAAAA